MRVVTHNLRGFTWASIVPKCWGSDFYLSRSFLWKRDPSEEKTEELLGTKQARHYLVLRKAWGKSLIANAMKTPSIGTKSLEMVHPNICGKLETTA